MRTIRINVPRLYAVCLDCKRQAEVPPRGSGSPVEVVIPCECGPKSIERIVLHLQYASMNEPAAVLPLQEGPPGMRV